MNEILLNIRRSARAWRLRQRGHLLFPVWTVVYWPIVYFTIIRPYDCPIEVINFVFSWIAPVIAIFSLGQDGLAMMLLPVDVFFFIKYWKMLFRFLQSDIKVVILTITIHMAGGIFLFWRYNASENRPDFGIAIAIIPPLSMLLYLAGYSILYNLLQKK